MGLTEPIHIIGGELPQQRSGQRTTQRVDTPEGFAGSLIMTCIRSLNGRSCFNVAHPKQRNFQQALGDNHHYS